MKKLQNMILCFYLVAIASCTSGSGKRAEKNNELVQNEFPANYKKNEFSDSAYRYLQIDSGNFKITHKFFLNGDLFVIHKVDTIHKIDFVTYFKNGLVSYTGQNTYPNNIPFGKWRFASLHKFSLMANYDDSLNINYSEALKIAANNGFKHPFIEFTTVTINDIKFWGIYRINNEKEMPQSILINSEDGTIKKIEYNLQSETDKIRF